MVWGTFPKPLPFFFVEKTLEKPLEPSLRRGGDKKSEILQTASHERRTSTTQHHQESYKPHNNPLLRSLLQTTLCLYCIHLIDLHLFVSLTFCFSLEGLEYRVCSIESRTNQPTTVLTVTTEHDTEVPKFIFPRHESTLVATFRAISRLV